MEIVWKLKIGTWKLKNVLTIKKILFLSLVVFILSSRSVLAYDSHFAHRQLVARTLALWQEAKQLRLDQEQIDWIVDGAEAEDYPAVRALNHFYDPTTARGLTVMGVQLGQAAPDWALDDKNQQSGWGGDFSWRSGVVVMKNGDEKLAWLALGHNLHLLADMASPAHTHNDDHAEGDPYERYIKYWLRDRGGSFDELGTLQAEATCHTLIDCLEAMATYTNSHTFSKDWSLLRDLPVGTVLSVDGKFYLDNKLIAKKIVGKYDVLTEKVMLDNEVFDAYLQVLAPLLIDYGQSVVQAYVDELDKELPRLELVSDVIDESLVSEPSKKPLRIIIPSIVIIDIKKPDLPVDLAPKLVVPDLKFDWPIVDESMGIPSEYLGGPWWQAVMSVGALPVSAASLDKQSEVPGSSQASVLSEAEGEAESPVSKEGVINATSSLPIDNNLDNNTADVPIVPVTPVVPDPPLIADAPSSSLPVLPPVLDEPEASSTPAIVEDAPSADFVYLPSQYDDYLQIMWQARPAGLWRYDLFIAYDDQPWQQLIKGEMRNIYMFSPAQMHSILNLSVVARLPDGTRVGTSSQVYFVGTAP